MDMIRLHDVPSGGDGGLLDDPYGTGSESPLPYELEQRHKQDGQDLLVQKVNLKSSDNHEQFYHRPTTCHQQTQNVMT